MPRFSKSSGQPTGRVLVLALLFASAGCGASAPMAEDMPPGPNDDTTLGPGDIFDVRVFGEDNLSGRYRVAQDGSIDFPFVGRVVVHGREPTQVADLLTEGLRDGNLLRNPQVSVMVHEYHSKQVTVMGAVSRTGQFPRTTGMTVVQAISLAGGFTVLANKSSTMVTRRAEDGAIQRFRVDVDAVTRGQSRDFVLRAGDIVYVPERAF